MRYPFQSTHPQGVRRAEKIAAFEADVFQSTHPQGVRLKSALLPSLVQGVSIHAPARGATFNEILEYKAKWFQSTHPQGVRLDGFSERLRYGVFQSTHPQGVRRGYPSETEADWWVSIHAPARGATRTTPITTSRFKKFQSTHPQGVRQETMTTIAGEIEFQSTHPQGVRRTCRRYS